MNIAVGPRPRRSTSTRSPGSSALQPHNWVGQHIPLHATSNGKVLLSELTESELKDAVPASCPGSPTRPSRPAARLRDELAEVREAGYAVAVDELEVGLTAAAAPIRNAHGDIIASMSISGPTFRLDSERWPRRCPLLVAAATEVSHRLGWGRAAALTPRTADRLGASGVNGTIGSQSGVTLDVSARVSPFSGWQISCG